MDNEGPVLEMLVRRLAECPADFLAEPLAGKTGVIHVAAVVADLLRALGQARPATDRLTSFQPAKASPVDRNRLRTVLVACWLLHDPWFRGRKNLADRAAELVAHDLNELADLVQAPKLVTDPERREELVRLCLKSLSLRPAGETRSQAEDRLTTLSSVERQRVIREARAAEERVREIREAMVKKAAEEAAAKYGRE